MRQILVAGAVLAIVTWLSPNAIAQQTKSARGTVIALSGNSLTVKAGTAEMKFVIDAKTVVNVTGGRTAERKAAASGEGGPSIGELIKVGNAVEVSYHETGSTLHAVTVRRISSPGSDGGGTSDQKRDSSSGTVVSVSGKSLTITGTGSGGSKFTQAFTIDNDTKVVGEGVGTAAAKAGGKISFTDHVGKGDRVTVLYRLVGTILHADEVRVTQKAK